MGRNCTYKMNLILKNIAKAWSLTPKILSVALNKNRLPSKFLKEKLNIWKPIDDKFVKKKIQSG